MEEQSETHSIGLTTAAIQASHPDDFWLTNSEMALLLSVSTSMIAEAHCEASLTVSFHSTFLVGLGLVPI